MKTKLEVEEMLIKKREEIDDLRIELHEHYDSRRIKEAEECAEKLSHFIAQYEILAEVLK